MAETQKSVVIVVPTFLDASRLSPDHFHVGQRVAHFMNWRGFSVNVIRPSCVENFHAKEPFGIPVPLTNTKQFASRPQHVKSAPKSTQNEIENENQNLTTKQNVTIENLGKCAEFCEAFGEQKMPIVTQDAPHCRCAHQIACEVNNLLEQGKKNYLKCCIVETPLIGNETQRQKLYEQLRGLGLPNDRIYFVWGPCQPTTDLPIVGCMHIGLPFESHSLGAHSQISKCHSLLPSVMPLEMQIMNHFSRLTQNGMRNRYPIILTRHGLSEDNVSGKLGGNSRLTPQGVAYSRLLHDFVSQRFKLNETTVWTSELIRTKMTAQPLKDAGYSIEEKKALNEIGAGMCEGYTYEEVKAKYPEIHAARTLDKYGYRYPEGESYADLVARLEVIVNELLCAEGPIVVVAHQAVLRCLLAFLMKRLPSECVGLDVPSHTVYYCTPTANGWDVNSTLLCNEHSAVPEGVGHGASFHVARTTKVHDNHKEEKNGIEEIPQVVVSDTHGHKAAKSVHKRQRILKPIPVHVRGLVTGGSGVVAEAVAVSPLAPLATQA